MPNHLVLGGRRSGKSAFAENLTLDLNLPKTYVATSRAYDEDHATRIKAHRARRKGQGWRVLEAPDPADLQGILDSLAGKTEAVLVDCLSMWLNNVFLDGAPVPGLTLPHGKTQFILVSLEVGLGVHPDTKLGRDYADALGTLNQSIARQADQVSLVIAGLPHVLKG